MKSKRQRRRITNKRTTLRRGKRFKLFKKRGGGKDDKSVPYRQMEHLISVFLKSKDDDELSSKNIDAIAHVLPKVYYDDMYYFMEKLRDLTDFPKLSKNNNMNILELIKVIIMYCIKYLKLPHVIDNLNVVTGQFLEYKNQVEEMRKTVDYIDRIEAETYEDEDNSNLIFNQSIINDLESLLTQLKHKEKSRPYK